MFPRPTSPNLPWLRDPAWPPLACQGGAESEALSLDCCDPSFILPERSISSAEPHWNSCLRLNMLSLRYHSILSQIVVFCLSCLPQIYAVPIGHDQTITAGDSINVTTTADEAFSDVTVAPTANNLTVTHLHSIYYISQGPFVLSLYQLPRQRLDQNIVQPCLNDASGSAMEMYNAGAKAPKSFSHICERSLTFYLSTHRMDYLDIAHTLQGLGDFFNYRQKFFGIDTMDIISTNEEGSNMGKAYLLSSPAAGDSTHGMGVPPYASVTQPSPLTS